MNTEYWIYMNTGVFYASYESKKYSMEKIMRPSDYAGKWLIMSVRYMSDGQMYSFLLNLHNFFLFHHL